MDQKSLRRLNTLNQRFARVLVEVDKYYPIRVLETHRNKERQNKLFRSGRSKLKFPMSKHNQSPSLAADVIPLPLPKDWGDKEWKHRVKFYEMSAIVMYEGEKQGLILRCGKDWRMSEDYTQNTFDDLVHLEVMSIDGRKVETNVNVRPDYNL